MSIIDEMQKRRGGSVVSRKIYERTAEIGWCYRRDPVNEVDNGWVFTSDADTKEDMSNPNSFVVLAWENLYKIEPEIAKIFDFPIGTELIFETGEDGKKHFYDADTWEQLTY